MDISTDMHENTSRTGLQHIHTHARTHARTYTYVRPSYHPDGPIRTYVRTPT